RAGPQRLSRRCTAQWAARRGLRAAVADRARRGAHCGGVRHRGRRDRICDRRAQRPPLLLRHHRVVQLRRRCAACRGLRPIRAARRLSARGDPLMRFGYWLPVFGGWLRNVEDERMEAEWSYVRRLARASERAELDLNDIKGPDAPALDAWSTAAALAAVTDRLELMVAVRPTFHPPALLAK